VINSGAWRARIEEKNMAKDVPTGDMGGHATTTASIDWNHRRILEVAVRHMDLTTSETHSTKGRRQH
jgi:hypothetical protein